MSFVCLYHASCPDGYGASWLLSKNLDIDVRIPVNYGQDVPSEVDGAFVYLVDFCYDTSHLYELTERAEGVCVLDHHLSAVGYVDEVGIRRYDTAKELVSDGVLPSVHAVINQNRSGIGNVAEYLVAIDSLGAPVPQFLLSLEDRDLWKFELDGTREIFAAVTSWPYTDEAWDRFDQQSFDSLFIQGQHIERYRQQLVQQCLDLAHQATLRAAGGRWEGIWVTNAPYAICSDVAGELAKRDPERFAATFYVDEHGWKWSLRSTEQGMDVAEIAAKMQPGIGGGHRHAAGFRVER